MEEREFQKKIEYTKIMLEEYRTLRSEIINKQSILNNITNFSFAIIGVNLAAITNILVKQQNNKNGDDFIIMATAIIIPLICGFAIIQYYLEFIYIARIARYIVAIEDNINTLFGEHLLFWESGIRKWDYNPHLPPKILNKIVELQTFMLIEDKYVRRLLILPLTFSIIAIFSVLISFYYVYQDHQINLSNPIFFYPIISVIICLSVFLLWRRLDKIIDTMHWSTLEGSTNESEKSAQK